MLHPVTKWSLTNSVLVAFLTLSVGPFTQALSASPQNNSSSVLGTWKGESICVGYRPACKNEVVVYRFEAVPGKPGLVTLLADKIIDGKRDPMGKLEFQYDQVKATLSCEFTVRQTHGLWQFKFTENEMEGSLILLPDKSIGRRVKVKRVSEDQVPPAPDRELYGG